MATQENEQLDHLRHTLAHVLAAAVLDLYPDAKPTLGPPVADGFYYDFDFGDTKITEADLEAIERRMREILPTWETFTHKEVSEDEARAYFAGNEYKHDIINTIAQEGGTITFYSSGGFTDLCRGGHLEHPATEIDPDAFELDRIAGAYWRGDETNPMLTRIYGLAFRSKDELQTYKEKREEARKRDHKKIGKELELFAFSERVGRGLPLFLPKGNVIREELAQYIRNEKEALGYQFVTIPHIAKKTLYETSGHMGKYDAMMPTMTDEHGDVFVMKAMNCPHHFELYNAQSHSYRDLPLRIAENTTVYRNEKSGELSGLFRVKGLTQDDTHHFVTPDQIADEIDLIVGLMNRVYTVFDFTDYTVQISIRDPHHKEMYFGDDALWQHAEAILIDAVKQWGVPYVVEEGEAAFYGPKIDIMVTDSIGREWQLTTVQLDFVQPENFDMTYTGADGEKHRPAVLHVAIFGSIERFLGILIEHYNGVFPLWLAPVQVAVLPISADAHGATTTALVETLRESGIRVRHDDENESIGKRIRAIKQEKIPYYIVVGDREIDSDTYTLEDRSGNKVENLTTSEIQLKLAEEIQQKS